MKNKIKEFIKEYLQVTKKEPVYYESGEFEGDETWLLRCVIRYLRILEGKCIYQKDNKGIIRIGRIGGLEYVDNDEICFGLQEGQTIYPDEKRVKDLSQIIFWADDFVLSGDLISHTHYEDIDYCDEKTWLISPEDYQKLTSLEALKNYRL